MKRLVATAALLSTSLAGAQEPGTMIEWPYVGAEQAHTKYSVLGGWGHYGRQCGRTGDRLAISRGLLRWASCGL